MSWFWRFFGFYTRQELVDRIKNKTYISNVTEEKGDVIYQLSTVYDPDYEKPTDRKFGMSHMNKWEAMARKHYEISEESS